MGKLHGGPTPINPATEKAAAFTTLLRNKWSWLTATAFALLAIPYIVPIVAMERWERGPFRILSKV